MVKLNSQVAKIQPGLVEKGLDKATQKDQGFKSLLDQQLQKTIPQPLNPNEGVKFSNHAIDRLRSRGIQFQAQDLKALNEAVQKAEAKGSKEALILMGDAGFVVSVKNKTVITAMDKAQMKENVFTNIDSTIVL